MKREREQELNIVRLQEGAASFFLRGRTPLIFNAPSEKSRHELLMPRKKTQAEKATQLKHDPLEEYRGSAYQYRGSEHSTRLWFPAGGFKRAMMTAAIETGGTSKASIARLVWVSGLEVSIYGIPQLKMDVTRSADIARTPDIRTRACLPQWAAELEVRFVVPKLNAQQIGNLLSAAGLLCGVGDWRQEKGSGSYGMFELCGEAEFKEVADLGGREQQDAALEEPAMYDIETERLFTWFNEEVARRRQAGDAAVNNGRVKRRSVAEKELTDGQ